MTAGGSTLSTGDDRRGLTLFITGANGFVGRYLADHAARHVNTVDRVVLQIRPEEFARDAPGLSKDVEEAGQGRIEAAAVPLDILDAETVREAVAHFKPELVCHLAARASAADGDHEAVLAVNAGGTRNLLNACAAVNATNRCLVVSTGYVYGNTRPGAPARETDTVTEAGLFGSYTDSKLLAELVAADHEMAVVARAFSHTGPGQTPTFAVPAFASQLASIEREERPPVLRVGNLDAWRDILDVRDVVRAYVSLLTMDSPGRVYNVATGAPVQMSAVLESLRAKCSVSTEVQQDPSRMRPSDIGRSSGDYTLLNAATGWEPSIPLGQTLEDTLNYWRAH